MSEQIKKTITETIKMSEDNNGQIDRIALFNLIEYEIQDAEVRGAMKLLHTIVFKSTTTLIGSFVDWSNLQGSKKEKDLYEVSGYLKHDLVKLLSCVDRADRVAIIKYVVEHLDVDLEYINKIVKQKV